MKRFLAATGISEFWDMDSGLILLGPWCLAEEKNRLLLRDRPYSVAPSPWKPAAKLKEAQDLCHEIYGEALHELSGQLNLLHAVSYDEKYWRVLVGPWLEYFVEILYERYKRIQNAFAVFPDAYTYALPESLCSLSAIDTPDFASIRGKIVDDYYNLKLFSLIIRCLHPDKFIERNIGQPPDGESVIPHDSFTKKLFYGIKILKDVFNRPDIILSDMHKFDCAQILSLELKSRPNSICFKHFGSTRIREGYDDYSEEQRSRLEFKENPDEFNNLLRRLIPRAIPLCYIENFDEYKKKVKLGGVKIVGSATGWYFNEGFKFFAAESVLKGVRLMDFQPGGGYGMLLSVPSEISSLERDVFFTWGWRSECKGKILPLSSPYLSRLKDTYKHSKYEILFVGTTAHKYLCRFASFITPDDIPQYFLDKKRFIDNLNKPIRQKLLCRPYYEVGWNEASKIKSLAPDIGILSKGKLVNLMQKSKMVVFDYFGTSTIEALIINAPTVCFYDDNINLIRPEAEKYFRLLKEAGILHKSPEEAADKINEIYSDPLKWWLRPEVQGAKDAFCDRFAATSSNWREEWMGVLNERR